MFGAHPAVTDISETRPELVEPVGQLFSVQCKYGTNDDHCGAHDDVPYLSFSRAWGQSTVVSWRQHQFDNCEQ